jgi:hypothetical protein
LDIFFIGLFFIMVGLNVVHRYGTIAAPSINSSYNQLKEVFGELEGSSYLTNSLLVWTVWYIALFLLLYVPLFFINKNQKFINTNIIMANYKRDAASNRDALFGGASGGGGSKKKAPSSSRASSTSRSSAPSAPSSAVRPSPSSAARTPVQNNSSNVGIHSDNNSGINSTNADPKITPGPSTIFGGKIASRNKVVSILSGTAKIDKMAEAEENRLKAKQAMTRGIFSKPDPISAANFYKRAADAYKACGENRLER